MHFKNKYLKYKSKYKKLKDELIGGSVERSNNLRDLKDFYFFASDTEKEEIKTILLSLNRNNNPNELNYGILSFNIDHNKLLKDKVNYWISNRVYAEERFGHISEWNTSLVTNMSKLFYLKDFNDDISSWDTSNVTDMSGMFNNCTNFNQDINTKLVNKKGKKIIAWDTSKVKNMSGMFNRSLFNNNIDNWDTSNVTNMYAMFYGSVFNKNINTKIVEIDNIQYISWYTHNVENMMYMFCDSNFNKNIDNWSVDSVKIMDYMFTNSTFNQNLHGKVVNLKYTRYIEELGEKYPIDEEVYYYSWQVYDTNFEEIEGCNMMFANSPLNQNIDDLPFWWKQVCYEIPDDYEENDIEENDIEEEIQYLKDAGRLWD